jgi:hypothetical protein
MYAIWVMRQPLQPVMMMAVMLMFAVAGPVSAIGLHTGGGHGGGNIHPNHGKHTGTAKGEGLNNNPHR